MYTEKSVVAVRPFTRHRDGAEVVIGNVETGVFLAVPPEAVDLLDQLASGKTVGEVAEWHKIATGETPDLAEFLDLLKTKGLVDREAVGSIEEKKSGLRISEPKYHFSGFPQQLARVLFGAPALVFGAIVTAIALALILWHHSLMPVPMDLVFSGYRAVGLTVLTVLAYAGIFLHETAHLVAARAVGVNSRMGVSHRLWYLVIETDLTGLWSVPRKQRYLPMLAGMLVDTLFIDFLILLLFAGQQHLFVLTPRTEHLLRAVAFMTIARISWELFLFMRTDVYYLAATFLNCKDLLNDTLVFLRNQLTRFTSRIKWVDQSGIPPSERDAIRAYAVLYLAGRAWAFCSLFWVTIPVCGSYWVSLVRAFRLGYSGHHSEFLDAVLASCYFLIPTLAGFAFWGRSLIHSKGV